MMRRLGPSPNLLPVFCVLAIMLGGASAGGILANAFLQIIAAIILVLVAIARNEPQRQALPPAIFRAYSALVITVAAIVIVPLIPLPPALWTALPGRALVVTGLEALGNPVGWRPLAIEPSRHVASALSFLPAGTALYLAMRADRKTLDRSLLAIVGAALLSVVIGALQLGQGGGSPLYFYDLSSRVLSIGFFRNSNHFATLFLASAVLSLGAIRRISRRRKRQSPLFSNTVWALIAGLFLLNLFLNRSLAGIGLSLGVIFYAALVALWLAEVKLRPWLFALVGLVFALGALALPLLAPEELIKMLPASTDLDTRILMWTNTLAAIRDTFPFGIGLGNFRWYYTGYQDFAVAMVEYINHAHNDWLEIVLEAGILGVAAIAIFFWSLFAAWRRNMAGSVGAAPLWAPWFALALILAHSLVDYPLRTSAMAVIAVILYAAILKGHTFDPAAARDSPARG